MIGLKVFNGGLYNSSFSNINMGSSNFENATIRNSIFKNCILLKSNFKDGTCKGISFEKPSIERVDYISISDDLLEQLKRIRPDMKYQRRGSRT